MYGVLGPNGAGKTTTVSVLASCDQTRAQPRSSATTMRARLDGRPVAGRRHRPVRIGRRRPDGERQNTSSSSPFCSGFSRKAAKVRADELLDEFSLRSSRPPAPGLLRWNASTPRPRGQPHRRTPPLLFLDEPTTGLDPRTRAQMWDTIRRLVADGATVLLTTQYLDEADQLADRIAVIDHGRVIADDTADALKNSVGAATLQLAPLEQSDAPRVAEIVERVLGEPRDYRQKPTGFQLFFPIFFTLFLHLFRYLWCTINLMIIVIYSLNCLNSIFFDRDCLLGQNQKTF